MVAVTCCCNSFCSYCIQEKGQENNSDSYSIYQSVFALDSGIEMRIYLSLFLLYTVCHNMHRVLYRVYFGEEAEDEESSDCILCFGCRTVYNILSGNIGTARKLRLHEAPKMVAFVERDILILSD